MAAPQDEVQKLNSTSQYKCHPKSVTTDAAPAAEVVARVTPMMEQYLTLAVVGDGSIQKVMLMFLT